MLIILFIYSLLRKEKYLPETFQVFSKRLKTFQKKIYSKLKIKIKKSTDLKIKEPKILNDSFCSYISGLIEGDGTIIVPTKERSIKGKINYPSVE